ncbi:hypothetical protein [Mycobacterium sp. 141]|uniref:hypothetical protein n=1 Tax=Mycobacterium sp. 141 TaxID=1120797 RepID=UPI00037BEC5A|nr:hypothetical protein [Mycobacterium sp. 141]
MANELHVDAAGLRLAAANSTSAASAAFTNGGFDAATGSKPSSAGIAAVNAALVSLQTRQTQRITGQAEALTTGSSQYDGTDGDGARVVSTVSV